MSLTEPGSPFPQHVPLAAVVEFGPFRFDHAERTLTRDGEEIRLPPRVIGVLELLLERRGKVVSKQALMDGAWGSTAVTETSLTEAISLLRQALGDTAQDPKYLETVHRRGYRFVASVSVETANARQPARSRTWGFPAAIIALLVSAIAAYFALRARPLPPRRTYVSLATVATLKEWSSLAISPDGRNVVYVAKKGENGLLHHRSLGGFETRVIDGTNNAYNPFFSPDGDWVAYFSDGKLMKVRLQGGVPIEIVRGVSGGGGTWSRDGSIIFTSPIGGLSRVPADGGAPTTLTVPDDRAGEVAHVAPQILPDGKSVLFTIFSTTVHSAKAAVLSLETGKRRVILEHAGGARFIPPASLVYSTSEAVRVAPFDPREARVTGPPDDVLTDVMANPFSGVLHLAAANDGTIVYFSGEPKETPVRELLRREANGHMTPYPTPPLYYRNLELAPDGRRAAVTILQEDRSDVWLADLETGTLNRLTFEGFNIEPVWSPDGAWIYYASNRSGPYNIYRRRADGQGAEERLLESAQHQYPLFWSPDGKTFVIDQSSPVTGLDIHLLERGDGGTWTNRPFVQSAGSDLVAEVSPDGRWIAYATYEGSEWNIFLQDFPQGRGKWQISTNGGYQPFWSADGATLSYQIGDKLVSVPLTFTGGGVQRGREQTIDGGLFALAQRGRVAGELTIIAAREIPETPRELRMITNWSPSRSPH